MRDYIQRSLADLHFYADSTVGDDNNDGKTLLTPKETIEAILALVPEHVVKGVCYIHLNGTFTLTASVAINSVVHGSGGLIVDGGTNWIQVAAAQTADISSVWTIGLSTLGLVPDQYAGYWLEVLDGPAAGQVRTIYSHTATTYTVTQKFSAIPGNANFRIVRPGTVITDPTSYSNFYFACGGQGISVVQGLDFQGTAGLSTTGGVNSRVCACMISGSGNFWANGTANLWLLPSWYSGFQTLNPLLKMGVTTLATSWYTQLIGVASLSVMGCVFLSDTVMAGCRLNGPGGCRFSALRLFNTSPQDDGYSFFYYSSSYQKCLISGSAGVGLRLDNSIIQVDKGGIIVQNCASHAIELKHSMLEFTGAGVVSGSGNGGAGLYAHAGSSVTFPTAQIPIVTGTIGDTSTDGTTEASTWAAIAGGVAIADASEFSLIKAV